MRVLLGLFFIFTTPAFGAMENCQKRAILSLKKSPPPQQSKLAAPGPLPASYDDFSHAEAALKSKSGPSYLNHLRGKYEFLKTGSTGQAKLVSGLHTHEALDFFKAMRPDISSQFKIKTYPNGVEVVALPKAAFSDSNFRYLTSKMSRPRNGQEIMFIEKTLFPKSWSDVDITLAIQSVLDSNKSLVISQHNGTVITGRYKNVNIKIVMRQDRIISVYPVLR